VILNANEDLELIFGSHIMYCAGHSGSDVSSQKGVSVRPNICTCQRQEAYVR